MLTPKHESLLEQYLYLLEEDIGLLYPNLKQEFLAAHSAKADIKAILAKEIPPDVIGWFLLTIQHWPHELRRRDTLKKARAQFPEGHILVGLLKGLAFDRCPTL